MRVLVTGANGLIGAAVALRLHGEGHEVVGMARAADSALAQFPSSHWIEADFGKLTTAERWRPLLTGIDAVVNCVGAFQSGLRDDLRAVHVDAPHALFAACAAGGPRRVVQMSAIGARTDGPTEFARTKGEGDAALAASDLDWVILRPGVVVARNVYGATAMLRGLAGLPGVVPMMTPGQAVQFVALEDVAETVAWTLSRQAVFRQTFELVHPQAITLADVVTAQRRWLGFAPARIVALPATAVRAVSAVADALGWLGWRSPARSTASAQIGDGIAGDPASWIATTGIRPRSYAEFLATHPSTLQDRWFARLYFLKPLGIATLAAFWIATGVIALTAGYAPALAHLAVADVGPGMAKFITIAGALFDIVLGALLLVRRTARAALLVMLAATPLYLLAGTLLAPQLWADPVGAYTKVIPLLLATLFTLAVLEER